MNFWKMNGCGNDFIIINNIIEKIPEEKFSYIAKTLCENHFSIGSDGLMIVDRSDKADFKMIFFNNDGSLGEMCGNGARCIARYAYENNLSKENQSIETTAGIVKAQRIDENNYKIRLNDPCNYKFDIDIEINNEHFLVDYVELGNPGIPHAIIHIENLKNYDEEKLFNIGRFVRYYKGFNKGANVNFYDIIDKDLLYERTYERGVEDFTYACGTGTGSVVSILTKKNILDGKNTKVDCKGGRLIIDIVKDEENIKDIFLTGKASIVCKGETYVENV